jgi:hypothetical protein
MPPSPEIPRKTHEPVGPTVGVIIILLLMLAGAIYFWSARQDSRTDSIPYIPGDTSGTTTG